MLKSAYREINMQWFCSQVHLLVGERGQNTAKLLLEQFIVSHFSCHRWWCIHSHLRTNPRPTIHLSRSIKQYRYLQGGTGRSLQRTTTSRWYFCQGIFYKCLPMNCFTLPRLPAAPAHCKQCIWWKRKKGKQRLDRFPASLKKQVSRGNWLGRGRVRV